MDSNAHNFCIAESQWVVHAKDIMRNGNLSISEDIPTSPPHPTMNNNDDSPDCNEILEISDKAWA
jgi:hypothetical protein